MEAAEFCVPQLNSSCVKPTRPAAEAMLVYVLLSAICIATVALNLLVIVSISHFRQLHTPTNLLLLSLAASDLLVGVVLMPVEILYIESCWFLGDAVCTLYYVADYVITSASVANMVLISLDRYVAICDPLRYPARVTRRAARVGVSLGWLGSLLYRAALLNDHLRNPGASVSCLGECVVVIGHVAAAVDLAFSFVLPVAVIVALYLRVFVVAVSQARALRSQAVAAAAAAAAAQHQRSGAVAVRKREMKAAGTLGLVVAVFLFCFCPYYAPTLAGHETSVDASAADFEIWLAHFNSCLNPVIYALFYPWFRKCIRNIVTLQVLKPGSRDVKVL